jgi:DNA replication protein DnaC
VIDEIGVQFGTESEQNHLFEVINNRMLEVKPTILVTNLLLNSPDDSVKTLRNYLGERTYDRMREVGMSICFDWQSHRGMK